mmetsp:Transcript_64156/g.196234  ORF Transcript_64156/g.196234 Transcript_64156/m.196234 type:complete len:253 (+) Transcript_64156:231-989(+)
MVNHRKRVEHHTEIKGPARLVHGIGNATLLAPHAPEPPVAVNRGGPPIAEVVDDRVARDRLVKEIDEARHPVIVPMPRDGARLALRGGLDLAMRFLLRAESPDVVVVRAESDRARDRVLVLFVGQQPVIPIYVVHRQPDQVLLLARGHVELSRDEPKHRDASLPQHGEVDQTRAGAPTPQLRLPSPPILARPCHVRIMHAFGAPAPFNGPVVIRRKHFVHLGLRQSRVVVRGLVQRNEPDLLVELRAQGRRQ